MRPADKFGPRPMQRELHDPACRSNGMSEDCLYFNVWAPEPGREKLPVLVYFYGGGFGQGDGAEPRLDGEKMARLGMVTVTVNYRLGVFGFFVHPELTKESRYHGSGNYALLDQQAALRWVRQNIAAFGGDPERVTIAGESAGSVSVSALMASPLAKDLIAGVIGESGSIVGKPYAIPMAEAEQLGLRFAATLGHGKSPSLATLRALPAERFVEAQFEGGPWFNMTVDGSFFPEPPIEIYAADEQAHVPLLAGSNSEESRYDVVLDREKPTVANHRRALRRLYGHRADEVFKLYPATNAIQVMEAARDLASDRFVGYTTWKWLDLATRTGGQPTYYYLFDRRLPTRRSEAPAGPPRGALGQSQLAVDLEPQPRGAPHAAEIEYALGNLDLNKANAWTPQDYAVSKVMQSYFADFIKTGNPNGPGLPTWPRFEQGQRLILDVQTRAEPEKVRARYKLFDRL